MPSYSSSVLRGDHFVPEADSDPNVQRKLRGHLEKIDYTAFASNREILAQALGPVDMEAFQRMAVACAVARAQWVKEAMTLSAEPAQLKPEQIKRLADLRNTYQELSSAYEGARRMVERGYLSFRG